MNLKDQLNYNVKEYKKHHRGRPSGTKVVNINIAETPVYDGHSVYNLRKKLNLTQASFSTVIGVSTRTVEGWEQGRGTPNKSSARLMSIIENKPSIISDIITVEKEKVSS